MIDVDLIGAGGPPGTNLSVYLKWDRYSALADFILRRYGLEVPLSFDMPQATYLPPVKWSICDWPERYVVEQMEPA